MDLILMFSSGLEIFSTFDIYHPVNGYPFNVHFNLIKSTIVNHESGQSIRHVLLIKSK